MINREMIHKLFTHTSCAMIENTCINHEREKLNQKDMCFTKQLMNEERLMFNYIQSQVLQKQSSYGKIITQQRLIELLSMD